MTPQEMLLRLALACFFGLIIGGERQARQKVAGVRTHVLVSLGSCLIMILSVDIASAIPNRQGDPGRMAAQVVSGIGFLGAGAILKEGVSVIGLTTAASLWLIAAVGLATGAGSFVSAGIATLFGWLTLSVLGRIDSFLHRKKNNHTLYIEFSQEKIPMIELSCILAEWNASILDITILKSEIDYSLVSITFQDDEKNISIPILIESILQIDGVIEVKKES